MARPSTCRPLVRPRSTKSTNRGQAAAVRFQPEDGIEVIATVRDALRFKLAHDERGALVERQSSERVEDALYVRPIFFRHCDQLDVLLERDAEARDAGVVVSDDVDYYRQCREVYLKPPEMPQRYNPPVKWGCPYDCGLCTDHEQHAPLRDRAHTERRALVVVREDLVGRPADRLEQAERGHHAAETDGKVPVAQLRQRLEALEHLEAATRKGIAVMNTPGANAVAVAEITLGLMLAMARKTLSGVLRRQANNLRLRAA